MYLSFLTQLLSWISSVFPTVYYSFLLQCLLPVSVFNMSKRELITYLLESAFLRRFTVSHNVPLFSHFSVVRKSCCLWVRERMIARQFLLVKHTFGQSMGRIWRLLGEAWLSEFGRFSEISYRSMISWVRLIGWLSKIYSWTKVVIFWLMFFFL